MTDTPVIATLTAEQLLGYAAGAARAAGLCRDLAKALGGNEMPAVAVTYALEQIRERLDEEATLAKALVRNAEADNDDADDDLIEDIDDVPVVAPPAAPAPPAERKTGGTPGVTYTEERIALIRAMVAGGHRGPAILDAVNALPGRQVTGTSALYAQLKKLGLRLRDAAPPAAMAPAALPVRPHATPVLSQEDLDEARALLRSRHGAKHLHEHFGGSLSWWQDWCALERETW